jgi:hypothetical protein
MPKKQTGAKGRQPAKRRARPKIKVDSVKLNTLRLMVAQVKPEFTPAEVDHAVFQMDFEAYKKFGRPLTGATWKKSEFGPIPT